LISIGTILACGSDELSWGFAIATDSTRQHVINKINAVGNNIAGSFV
jgi:hypothetical protein